MSVFKEKYYGQSEWRLWVVWLFWSVVVCLFVLAATVGIRTVGHTVAEAKCAKQAQFYPELTVEFVDWNYFEWSCMVATKSGVSVPTDAYRAIVEGD